MVNIFVEVKPGLRVSEEDRKEIREFFENNFLKDLREVRGRE